MRRATTVLVDITVGMVVSLFLCIACAHVRGILIQIPCTIGTFNGRDFTETECPDFLLLLN
jgi:hypothetical protein